MHLRYSPQQWIKQTNAIGIVSKSDDTAEVHTPTKDIAFEFASWLSSEFKLYVIKDYQRLKQDESYRLSLDWNVSGYLQRQTTAYIPTPLKKTLFLLSSKQQQGYVYADEADVLNVALFGKTAAQWRKENPGQKGICVIMPTHWAITCFDKPRKI